MKVPQTSQVVWEQPFGRAALKQFNEALESSGRELTEIESQRWDFETATIGGVRDKDLTSIGPAATKWSSALLTLRYQNHAFIFEEHDQLAWGYQLFRDGVCLDRFCSRPGVIEERAADCAGDPSILQSELGVSPNLTKPYLRRSSFLRRFKRKAFPDDEFELSDHWVRIDFMRRLGFAYPHPTSATWYRIIRAH
jgi:hypothetical protein